MIFNIIYWAFKLDSSCNIIYVVYWCIRSSDRIFNSEYGSKFNISSLDLQQEF